MSIEELWYESSPYLYVFIGVLVLIGSPGGLGKASGGLLLVAAGTILRLRWVHRHERAAARERKRAEATAARRRTQAARASGAAGRAP